MRYFCMVAVLASFAGCQPDQEDRDFFYSGWVHPQEGSNMRMYGTKKSPEEEHDHNMEPIDSTVDELPRGN